MTYHPPNGAVTDLISELRSRPDDDPDEIRLLPREELIEILERWNENPRKLSYESDKFWRTKTNLMSARSAIDLRGKDVQIEDGDTISTPGKRLTAVDEREGIARGCWLG